MYLISPGQILRFRENDNSLEQEMSFPGDMRNPIQL